MYELLGKIVRGLFGLPSGTIATNPDTGRYMVQNIPQLGWLVGKSTTIEPKLGNKEDIFVLTSVDSGGNAVGYTNPGLEETVEGFKELGETCPDDVFLMPQIGESDEERFAHCAAEFDKVEAVDGIEINVSCPHAKQGGILIGADPRIVQSIVAAVRKATKKPLIVKLNAGVEKLEEIAKAAVAGGANAISAINTLGGPNPELYNEFGGFSGPRIFPATVDAIRRLREAVDVQLIAMGGIAGADDIRTLQAIDKKLFFGIGTSLAQMDSDEIKKYFSQLERDLVQGENLAVKLTQKKKILNYEPFVVKDIEEYGDNLRLIRFYQQMEADIGQYVMLKVDNKHAKPFSVANDTRGLELVIRKVGEATEKIFDLKKNSVVRIKGPYGKRFEFEKHQTVVFIGAGCGIAPIYHAGKHHNGNNIFIVGAKNKKELVYLDEMQNLGEVHVATDDGSLNYSGTVTELLERYLNENNLKDVTFFNCGPEIAMKKADEIERKYSSPDKIFHLVERICSCNEGICGKCSTPSGLRVCRDGPVFSAEQFTPGKYTRDKYGRKKFI